jgi:hypothetical protein
MSTLDDLPIVSGAVLILHDGVLYGVRYLPDGTPCPWDTDDEEPQPVHLLEWSTLDAPIRRRLLDGIRRGVS